MSVKIVKYWAPWCSPCIKYAPIFEGVVKELGVASESINIDKFPQDDIQSIPVTRIYNDAGEKIAEKFGPMSKGALKKWIAETTSV